MPLTKTEFDAWAVTTGAAIQARQALGDDAAAEDIATADALCMTQAQVIKNAYANPSGASAFPFVYSCAPDNGTTITSASPDSTCLVSLRPPMNGADLTSDTVQVIDENGDPYPQAGDPTVIDENPSGTYPITTVVLATAAPFAYDVFYRIRVKAGVRDIYGNPLPEDVTQAVGFVYREPEP